MKKNDKKINIDDLQKRSEELKSKAEDYKKLNPYSEEYSNKLKELSDLQFNDMDNFINWITGLSFGAILLIVSITLEPLSNSVWFVIFIVISLLAVVSSFLFKIFLKIRYGSRELDINILQNLWEGDNLRNRFEKMIQDGMMVSEEDQQKFLLNQKEKIDFLDKNYLEALKKSTKTKVKLLNFFYYSASVLFIIEVLILAIIFIGKM